MNKNGFTLIEVLIAITVFSIVVVLLFSSFKAFMVSTQTVKDELRDSQKMSIVFNRIRQDLLSIYIVQPPRYRTPEFNSDPDPYRMVGELENINHKTVSTLMLATFAHTNINAVDRPGAARVVYYVKENSDEGLDLYRSDSAAPYPEEIKRCFDPVLCTNVKGFEITYIDNNGDEHTNWDSDDTDFGYSYPKSIEFKILTGSDETSNTHTIAVNLQAGRNPIE